jgi:hypothetical protein
MCLCLARCGGLAACLASGIVLSLLCSAGCASGSETFPAFGYWGTPYYYLPSADFLTDSGTAVESGSGLFSEDERTETDPCSESLDRKFVRISMRNLAPFDHIHYFLVLVAYIDGEAYPDGAVCPDDVDLYTQFGYVEIQEGTARRFGNLCIVGPALLYFHEAGQFRHAGGGGSGLASAIAPAQGNSPTYDNFFDSVGREVPVPDLIIFHNPGTGDGRALQISIHDADPCDFITAAGDPDCQQDAFYYVDESDRLAGSTALGLGSGRRVPSEIQGTACECLGFDEPWQQLAPSGATAASARCNEFLRGGRIDYVFVREDTDPAFPQLVWRVTDANGAVAHEFDPRADVP